MPSKGWRKDQQPEGYEWGSGRRATGSRGDQSKRIKKAHDSLPPPIYKEARANDPTAQAKAGVAARPKRACAAKETAVRKEAVPSGLLDVAQVAVLSEQLDDSMHDVEGGPGGVVRDDGEEGGEDAPVRKRARRVAADEDDGDGEAQVAGDAPEEPRDEADARLLLPLLEVSLTLARRQAHVLPAWRDAVYRFIKDYCEAGGVVLERGKKNEWLHCQVILRLHWDPTKLEALKLIVKNYCGIAKNDGLKSVCECHVFREGQNWVTMVGYLHKDRAKGHFSAQLLNISEEEVAEGIQRWTQAALSYEDGKMVLNKSNVFKNAHAYYTSHPQLKGETLIGTLTEMLNCKQYVPAYTLLGGAGGGLREEAAETFWRCVNGAEMTDADARVMFCSPEPAYRARPGSRPQESERYYGGSLPPGVSQYPPAVTPVDASDLYCEEGFLASDNPAPAPAVRRDNLSTFTNGLLARRAAQPPAMFATARDAEADEAGPSEPLHPDSPRSPEGSRHASDDEWLDDDGVEDEPEVSARVLFAREQNGAL